MTDETLKQENEVLKAIADLSKSMNDRFEHLETKFDKFAEETNAQFEAIRQGILDNDIRFDHLESQIYAARSDISDIKANLKQAKRDAEILAIEK